MKSNFKFLILIFAFVLLFSFNNGYSQTNNQVVITWRAYNYYPSDYPGKALAATYNQILISTEVLKNNKFLDLAGATFSWQVDGKLAKSGLGLKEQLLNITKLQGDSYFIRVLIESAGEKFEGTLRIPVVSPKIIIENPFPNNFAKGGQSILFQAVPYFFNIRSLEDLTFSWKINGEPTPQYTRNQILIELGVPPDNVLDNSLNINVLAQNRLNPLELNENSLRLKVTKP